MYCETRFTKYFGVRNIQFGFQLFSLILLTIKYLTSKMTSLLLEQFQEMSCILDFRDDKAIRIVGISREITVQSKRIIFFLHRSLLQSPSEKEKLIAKAEKLLENLRNYNFRQLAKELKNESHFYYNRSYSPGMQEYIEAVSFWKYLKDDVLISQEEVQNALIFSDDEGSKLIVPVTQNDFMLGLLDMTGECMRASINSVPGPDHFDFNLKTCKFLQLVHEGFTGVYGYQKKEFSRKIGACLTSLLKVENYAYNLKIRDSLFFEKNFVPEPLFLENNNPLDQYDSGLD